LTPKAVQKPDLRLKFVDPKTIGVLVQLRDIYNEVTSGDELVMSELKTNVNDAKDSIVDDAEKIRSENYVLSNPNEDEHKLLFAEKLKEILLKMPHKGTVDDDNIYEVQKTLLDLIRNFTLDSKILPEKLNRKVLRGLN